jgi:hypothetical protein
MKIVRDFSSVGVIFQTGYGKYFLNVFCVIDPTKYINAPISITVIQ